MCLVDDHQRKKSLLNVTLTLALVVFPIPNLEAKYHQKVRYFKPELNNNKRRRELGGSTLTPGALVYNKRSVIAFLPLTRWV